MPTDALVRYTPLAQDGSLVTSLAKTQGTSDRTLDHRIDLTSLSFGTVYAISIESRDSVQNLATQSLGNFTTTVDEAAPDIIKVSTNSTLFPGSIDKVQTLISWLTDEPATTQVFYEEGVRTDDDFRQQTSFEDALVKKHLIVLSDLKPGSVYRFRVSSRDAAENSARSKDFTILTPKQQETVVQIIIKNFEDTFSWLNKLGL